MVRLFSSPNLEKGSSFPRTFAHQRFRSWLMVPVPTSPRRYSLETFSILITASLIRVFFDLPLDRIHEALLYLVEDDGAQEKDDQRHARAIGQGRPAEAAFAEEAVAECLHYRAHRIDLQHPSIFWTYFGYGVDNGGRVHHQ